MMIVSKVIDKIEYIKQLIKTDSVQKKLKEIKFKLNLYPYECILYENEITGELVLKLVEPDDGYGW